MLDKHEMLKIGTMKDYVDYNNDYDAHPDYQFTEASKYDLDAMEKWLSIRDKLTFIKDYEKGDWRILPITTRRTKYGTNYIYVDVENKKWRIRENPAEFYGDRPPMLQLNEIR